MAITFTATLNPGAVSVADANWSDAAGFNHATAAKLLIRAGDENQTISGDLDQAGSTAAVDLLHIVGGFPRIVGTSQAPLIVKFDNTYTDEPNLLWDAQGGVLYVEANTNACVLAAFYGGGEINLLDGAFTRIACHGPVIKVAGACDVATEAIVTGGSCTLEASADTLPNARVAGNGYLHSKRRVETAATLSGSGRLRIYNTTGSGLATLNMYGGTFHPELGDVATIVRQGGRIDLAAARGAVALGGTAITNYGPSAFPTTAGLVTIGGGTLTDYAKYAVGASGPAGGV